MKTKQFGFSKCATVLVAGLIAAASAMPSFAQKATPNIHVGINAPTPTSGRDSQEIADIRDLGVGLVRINVPNTTSPSDSHIRGIKDVYEATGARFVLTIPPSVSADTVVSVCQMLGSAVYALEGCNEPDNAIYSHGDMASFATQLAAQIKAVKNGLSSAGLNIPIIGSAFTGDFVRVNKSLPKVGAPIPSSVQDYNSLADYGNEHDYLYPDQLASVNDTRSRSAAYWKAGTGFQRWLYGNKSATIVTEMGLSTWNNGVTTQEQATNLPIMIKRDLAFAKAVIIYQLYDRGSDMSDRLQGYGLITADGVRKPAFAAIANLNASMK